MSSIIKNKITLTFPTPYPNHHAKGPTLDWAQKGGVTCNWQVNGLEVGSIGRLLHPHGPRT